MYYVCADMEQGGQPEQPRDGHYPVMLPEVLDFFAPTSGEGGVFLDCTFGGGGHSRALLDAHPQNRVWALDQDPQAIARAAELQSLYGDRFEFIDANFEALAAKVPASVAFDGILFDLGVSSFQLDQAERGFSFRKEAPLDMRMDNRSGQPASEFLNNASEADLIRAVREYGEEPRWRRVISAILDARGTPALETTTAFAALVESVLGHRTSRRGHHHRSRIHPATQVFQGVRIAVNEEMRAVEVALPAAFAKLRTGGCLAIITFHSLEDRLVKRAFRELAGRPVDSRDSRPQDDRVRRAEMLTRKPLTASAAELQENSRSRSAKLRAIRREV